MSFTLSENNTSLINEHTMVVNKLSVITMTMTESDLLCHNHRDSTLPASFTLDSVKASFTEEELEQKQQNKIKPFFLFFFFFFHIITLIYSAPNENVGNTI